MKTCTVTLRGASPYSQSRPFQTEIGPKESHEAFEKRCWSERLHKNGNGDVIIPPTSLKDCLWQGAKYLSIKKKGQQTWTKHFRSGVMVVVAPVLTVKADEVEGEWLFLNADGKKGSGTRVWRCYPKIPEGWQTNVSFVVLDDEITQDIFFRVLRESGMLIGIGRFRPENGGYYGRFDFDPKEAQWVEG